MRKLFYQAIPCFPPFWPAAIIRKVRPSTGPVLIGNCIAFRIEVPVGRSRHPLPLRERAGHVGGAQKNVSNPVYSQLRDGENIGKDRGFGYDGRWRNKDEFPDLFANDGAVQQSRGFRRIVAHYAAILIEGGIRGAEGPAMALEEER